MGCVSSKIISRSLSYQEEKRQTLERTTKSNPFLQDLISSSKGGDPYLAFVCAADAIASRLQLKSFSSNASTELAMEFASPESIDKVEWLAALAQGEDKQQGIVIHEHAKSYHWLPEHVAPLFDQKASDEGCEGIVRSRSFHTVEEYDALVSNNWLSELSMIRQKEIIGDDHDPSEANMHVVASESSLFSADDHTEDENYICEKWEELMIQHGDDSVEEKSEKTEFTDYTSGSATEIKVLIENPAIADHSSNEVIPGPESNDPESVVCQSGNLVEKGFKRKIVSKRLNMLQVPSTVEHPVIASLKEWLPPDGIYSPGSYVTPKFGSYSLPNNETQNASNESIVFSPELVDAFEQCMQQLVAEEESILKYIVENSEEDGAVEIANEEIMPCTL